jgi:hypothetical protein
MPHSNVKHHGRKKKINFFSRAEAMLVGLTLVGKDIVFRFIIEYSSLMDFGP